MRKRTVKVIAVVGAAAALVTVSGATAWADAITPAIEEPLLLFKLPGGQSLTGASPDGNYSSARGRDGDSDDGGDGWYKDPRDKYLWDGYDSQSRSGHDD